MEGYQMPIECDLIEHRLCTSCGFCKEIEALEAYYEQSQDYEPTDEDLESEMERKWSESECKIDNYSGDEDLESKMEKKWSEFECMIDYL